MVYLNLRCTAILLQAGVCVLEEARGFEDFICAFGGGEEFEDFICVAQGEGKAFEDFILFRGR